MAGEAWRARIMSNSARAVQHTRRVKLPQRVKSMWGACTEAKRGVAEKAELAEGAGEVLAPPLADAGVVLGAAPRAGVARSSPRAAVDQRAARPLHELAIAPSG